MASPVRRSTQVMGLVVAALVAPLAVSFIVACGSSTSSSPTVLSHPSASPSPGRLISAPFSAGGVVKVTADFAGQSSGDQGVAGFIVPPERAHEGFDALTQEPGFVVSPSSPTDSIHGMTGRFVIVVDVPGPRAWTLTVQSGQ